MNQFLFVIIDRRDYSCNTAFLVSMLSLGDDDSSKYHDTFNPSRR